MQGVRATSAVRTLFDLARRLPPIEAVPLIDVAVRRRLVTLEALRSDWIRRAGARHGQQQHDAQSGRHLRLGGRIYELERLSGPPDAGYHARFSRSRSGTPPAGFWDALISITQATDW